MPTHCKQLMQLLGASACVTAFR